MSLENTPTNAGDAGSGTGLGARMALPEDADAGVLLGGAILVVRSQEHRVV